MKHRTSILVIDDDPLFRSLIASLLRRDFTVLVAAEGAEGFYRALESRPDVAVVDLQMPGWDGLKTLKAFRSHPALASLRTIVLTADAKRGTVLTAIQAGADEYLLKDHFSKETFFEKLAKLLPRESSPAVAAAGSAHTADGGGPPIAAQDLIAPPIDEEQLQEIMDEWE